MRRQGAGVDANLAPTYTSDLTLGSDLRDTRTEITKIALGELKDALHQQDQGKVRKKRREPKWLHRKGRD